MRKEVRPQSPTPKSIAPEVLTALESYSWPGNVRELENVIRRATVVAKGEAILLSDLPAEVIKPAVTGSIPPPTATAFDAGATSSSGQPSMASLAQMLFTWARRDSKFKVLPAVERELIINALAETGGNQVQAARLLGITRATLRKRIEKFHIKQELSIR